MRDYLARIVRSMDEGYGAAVDFSLAAYESVRLRPVRQAFPAYVSLSRHGSLVGVCGFRSASGGLFLEQFMLETIDEYVSRLLGEPVSRAAIVELGAFRVKSPAITPLLVSHIERMLAGEGFSHALALSPRDTGMVTDWARARESLARPVNAGPVDHDGNASLKVSVLPLTGQR